MSIYIVKQAKELAFAAWPGLVGYASKLEKISDGRVIATEMLAEFASGQKELWAAYDDQTWEALGFWSQEIQHWGARKTLFIQYVAGKDMRRWLPDAMARIDSYGREHEVDMIEGTSPRKGWSRMIERYGFQPYATVYVRNLKHELRVQDSQQDGAGPDDHPRLAETGGDVHDRSRARDRE